MNETLQHPNIDEPKTCAVCGEVIQAGVPAKMPYPPNGDWIHEDGEDGCEDRYWDPPDISDMLR